MRILETWEEADMSPEFLLKIKALVEHFSEHESMDMRMAINYDWFTIRLKCVWGPKRVLVEWVDDSSISTGVKNFVNKKFETYGFEVKNAA